MAVTDRDTVQLIVTEVNSIVLMFILLSRIKNISFNDSHNGSQASCHIVITMRVYVVQIVTCKALREVLPENQFIILYETVSHQSFCFYTIHKV